ncbi:phosphoribosylanthranilate isomerase [Jeotgalibacillus campisalis]|uniref:N-(5'-phosphoribosyl)anthranilate isomerase n=1 Tax=Jeotgalibacillus campisalis TaxID=220754 RepID=A0A0C2RCB5_9BACL|nr:phosphoribosylanthranilate isomerase [Jeotgalibacillus campisalis]KIL47930.1 phosphoribosylanthranilate isomerase [Jeotgalibacillus campisalis]
MKVKICGIQKSHHIKAAVSAGADYIGFMFAQSKRRIEIQEAAELAAQIPAHVKRVGVFVNPSQQEIDEAVQKVDLDLIQLHGDETPHFCRNQVKPVMKAFSITSEDDFKRMRDYDVAYYLVDAPGTDYRGGSGRRFDWSLIPENHRPEKLVLAGGLTPENVGEAVTEVKPYAVDVSSGVEVNGEKDSNKIIAFIHEAKGVRRNDNL